MNTILKQFIAPIVLLALVACNKNKTNDRASGSFEAIETIISSEAMGRILSITIDEGSKLDSGQVIGYIDSTQLCLNRDVLLQNQKAVLTNKPDIRVQLDALESELKIAQSDRDRIAKLVKGDVASPKQLDDADARVATIKAKIAAQKSSLQTSTNAINEQGGSLEAQLNQLNDQIKRCVIRNPVNGTVLAKYVETAEMTSVGRPLYKIADLSTLILRCYVTGDQLTAIKLDQQVKVLTDDGNGGFKETSGIISWISDKSEFTPKTIQTQNERANLVYAIKVKVPNDGSYKIGMYGEIKFE